MLASLAEVNVGVTLLRQTQVNLALDGGDNLTYIAPTMVNLRLAQERHPDVQFRQTREH